MSIKLGFNVDHIATLRNARSEGYPNLIDVAKLAIKAGANQITAHLREDRRHIKDADMFDLKKEIDVDLNMEMALTEEMVDIAVKLKPYSVCIVPEKRQEITTEGGLNVKQNLSLLQSLLPRLNQAKIKVHLFLDAELSQIEEAFKLPIEGVEINTGKYSNLKSNTQEELENIQKASTIIYSNNLSVHAGHGLNYDNIVHILKIKEITEFNIGHFLVSNSLFVGVEKSISKMINIINQNK